MFRRKKYISNINPKVVKTSFPVLSSQSTYVVVVSILWIAVLEHESIAFLCFINLGVTTPYAPEGILIRGVAITTQARLAG